MYVRFGVFVAAVCASAALFAQEGYTPQDIEGGGLIYQTNCAGCHGPEGDGVAGVNLGSGRFRRGTTDDEIVRIILGGIPGTAMPPSSFSEGQAGTVVAYLRSLAASPALRSGLAGDAGRGRTIFDGKGQCATCHSVKGAGSRVGPNLTEIGSIRRAVELERSLLDPDAEIRSDNRSVRAVTREGTAIAGRFLNQDRFTLQLLDSNERLLSLQKSSLREYTISKSSTMPSYRDKLSGQEVADVVSFLVSLKGRP